MTGSDQQDHWGFGRAVALDGDTAIVGAMHADIGGQGSQGAAYVFVRQGAGWIEQAELVASDGAEQNWFGAAVAIDGDTAVVGAPLADIEGQTFQGAAYVFDRTGEVWIETQKLAASDGRAGDSFGYAVEIEGEFIVATAISADIGSNAGQGAAYVFRSVDDAWLEEAKLLDPEGHLADLLGGDLAFDGDTAVIGAHSAEIDGDPNRGAAYVFVRNGGAWSMEAKLLASDGANPDTFGSAVALNRDRIVVGAEQKSIDGNPRQGAAYLFRRDGAQWIEEQRVTASDGHAEANFGKAAALADNVALVGAEFDFPGDPERGVVYEFRRQRGTWREIQKFAAPIGQEFDSFGHAIDLTSDRALIGNPDNVMVDPNGTAWIFRRPVLFADGFESGDTGAWGQTVP